MSFPLTYSRLNRSPVNLRTYRYKPDIPCVCAVSILERCTEDRVLAVRGAVMFVRGIGRGFEHLVVPAFVEESLSDVYQATRVRDESAKAKR